MFFAFVPLVARVRSATYPLLNAPRNCMKGKMARRDVISPTESFLSHPLEMSGVVDVVTSCPILHRRSGNSLEPVAGDQSEELQRSSLRVFFAPFPLADETGRHI